MQALWQDYKEQMQVSLNTDKRWAPVMRQLEAFVGVADVRDITEDHLVLWRDHLVKNATDPRTGKKLQLRTIKETYIAAVKASDVKSNARPML